MQHEIWKLVEKLSQHQIKYSTETRAAVIIVSVYQPVITTQIVSSTVTITTRSVITFSATRTSTCKVTSQ